MAGEAKPPVDPATAAPPPASAGAPQPPPSDSPPAAAAAAAPPAEAAPAAGPEPTLLQKASAEAPAADAKPVEGDKPAAEADKPKPEGDKPAEAAPADGKPVEAKPDDGKPADKPKEGDKPSDKPAETKPEAKPLEPVAYEYALPETLKMDDARKGEFHAALDGFRQDPSKGAQGLIALHEKAMTEFAQQVEQNQRDVWNQTRKGWQKDTMADEQIGGAGHATAMQQIARMRDLFVPEKERKAFDEFLQVTGAGDHPAFLRMLHRAGRYFDEARMPPTDIRPAPDNGRAPGRRGALLYDHPRSPNNRQQQ